MPVSSKLIMTVSEKNIMEIGSTIESTLNDILRTERKKNFGNNLRPWTQDKMNSNSVKVEAKLASESFIFLFTYKGERRQLWLFTKYDNDNNHITNQENVFLSLGMWGNYKEILETIKDSLKEKYPQNEFFFDFNDCDNIYHMVNGESLVEVSY